MPEVGKSKTRHGANSKTESEREREKEKKRSGEREMLIGRDKEEEREKQTGIYPANEEEVDHRRVSAASLTIAGGSSTPRS